MDRSETATLPFDCRQLFELVADIERYPDFLPGWLSARILAREGGQLRVEQVLQAGPARLRFRSRAQLQPCSRIHIETLDGPLRGSRIEWRFTALDGGRCQLQLHSRLAASNPLLELPLQWLAGGTGRRLLPLFEQRARRLYGNPQPPDAAHA